MDLPGTNTGQTTFFFADLNGAQNLLQGTSGPITADLNGHGVADNVWSGPVGNNELEGGSGFFADSNFFPEGGFDDILLESNGRNDIWFAQYDIGHSGTTGVGKLLTQAVTDVNGSPRTCW
jgi:hypothetical protein